MFWDLGFFCVYVLCTSDVIGQGSRFRALEVDEYVTYSSNILSIHSSKVWELEGDIEASVLFVCVLCMLCEVLKVYSDLKFYRLMKF
jgi:hypothetical protein